jgi:hypothetical protein
VRSPLLKVMMPLSGVSMPAMHFSNVLLPVPLRATMAVFWPFSNPKEMSLKSWRGP